MINNTVLFSRIDDKSYEVTDIKGGGIGTVTFTGEEYTYQPNLYNKYTNLQLMEISDFIDNLNAEAKLHELFGDIDIVQERLKNNE